MPSISSAGQPWKVESVMRVGEPRSGRRASRDAQPAAARGQRRALRVQERASRRACPSKNPRICASRMPVRS